MNLILTIVCLLAPFAVGIPVAPPTVPPPPHGSHDDVFANQEMAQQLQQIQQQVSRPQSVCRQISGKKRVTRRAQASTRAKHLKYFANECHHRNSFEKKLPWSKQFVCIATKIGVLSSLCRIVKLA